MIDNEFGNDILTLEDDDGVEHTFEVLDAIDNGENRYMALSPVFDDPQESLDDSGELVILKGDAKSVFHCCGKHCGEGNKRQDDGRIRQDHAGVWLCI